MLRVANRVVAKKPFLLHEQQSDGCVGCLGDTVELRACAETSPVPRRIPGSIVLLTDQGLDQIDGDLDAVALPSASTDAGSKMERTLTHSLAL